MSESDRREFLQRAAVAGVAAAAVGAAAEARAQESTEAAPPSANVWPVEDLAAERREKNALYLPFFRSPAMHMGIYALKAGATDPQPVHNEDEAYYVLQGRGKFTADGETFDVNQGDLIYVRAKAVHKFEEIAEDLELLVFFSTAPAEG